MPSLIEPSDPPRPPCILVADDDAQLVDILTALLTGSGYRTIAASSGQDAIAVLRETDVDIVLTDIQMPGATGVDVLRTVRERSLDAPVILMTGNPTLSTAVEGLRLGAMGYLEKPVPAAKLLETVSEALSLVRLTRVRRQALADLVSEPRFMADRAGLDVVFARARAGLWMAYQPVVWARDGSLFGHEALLRTKTPEVPQASVFLDIAERLERIPEVGRQVRASVAGDLAGMAGVVLVNAHPLELADPELGTDVDPLSLHADRVVVEITERASLDGVKDLRGVVGRLRARGFRIAVDDLGAGYAALSTFASLEPDFVKIDISLVRGIDSQQTRRKLVAAIVELCRDLRILVVAEGIETEAERGVLVDLGCDLLQGFLVGRPAPLPPTR